MILIAGGTGVLGRETVRLLTNRGLQLRVLTRSLERARDLEREAVEVAVGDVRNAASLGPALVGVHAVISALSGYGPNSGADPRTVDGDGNANLIRAAERAGVEHFVLVSVHAAAPDHPMELMRMKFLAEKVLKGSRLAWTIIRPTAFMETWATVVGGERSKGGRPLILGRGENPINFVSAHDVARLVERAVLDEAMRGLEIDIGGPENLTLKEFATTLTSSAGMPHKPRRIPRTALRLMGMVARPINPAFARLAHDAVVMDTQDFTFDPPGINSRHMIPSTSLTQVLGSGWD